MPTAQPYSSRIIKASALIPDTKALLAAWDPSLSVAENLDRARRNNVLGKASRSRLEDVLTILRQRYFSDPDVGAALAALVQGGAAAGRSVGGVGMGILAPAGDRGRHPHVPADCLGSSAGAHLFRIMGRGPELHGL